MSASPFAIISAERPIASRPEQQALWRDIVRVVPPITSLIDAPIALTSALATEVGNALFGPFLTINSTPLFITPKSISVAPIITSAFRSRN
jgi:hypothetical protein